MTQLDLVMESRFEEFHRQHPHVYQELVRLARQAVSAGRRRLGIRMLWERLRWTLYVERKGDDYKLNDHLTAPYSRLIMRQEPDLRGLFETRGNG